MVHVFSITKGGNFVGQRASSNISSIDRTQNSHIKTAVLKISKSTIFLFKGIQSRQKSKFDKGLKPQSYRLQAFTSFDLASRIVF